MQHWEHWVLQPIPYYVPAGTYQLELLLSKMIDFWFARYNADKNPPFTAYETVQPAFCLYWSLFFFSPRFAFLSNLQRACFTCASLSFFPFHCLLPHAVAFGMGEDICRAKQPEKGIFKALPASQLFCSLSAGAAFCRRFLHETFSD